MFWALVEKGVIVQRVIALALTGVCCYLWVTGKPIPTDLKAVYMIIIGFFFSTEITGLFIKHLLEEISGRR